MWTENHHASEDHVVKRRGAWGKKMNSESEMMLQYEIESVTNMVIMSDRMTLEMMMSDDVSKDNHVEWKKSVGAERRDDVNVTRCDNVELMRNDDTKVKNGQVLVYDIERRRNDHD